MPCFCLPACLSSKATGREKDKERFATPLRVSEPLSASTFVRRENLHVVVESELDRHRAQTNVGGLATFEIDVLLQNVAGEDIAF
jgi:hypothetical protein